MKVSLYLIYANSLDALKRVLSYHYDQCPASGTLGIRGLSSHIIIVVVVVVVVRKFNLFKVVVSSDFLFNLFKV